MALRKMKPWAPRIRSVEAKACQGKTRWSGEQAAQRALANLRRENPHAFDSTVRPYRCLVCKRWHLGHGA